MTKLRVCITGCGGASGKLFCETYSDKYVIRGTDLKPVDLPEFIQADITDLDQLLPAFDGQDVVLHTAALHPFHKPPNELYIDVNIRGTLNVFEAGRRCGVKKIVFVSSISAVGYARRPHIVDEHTERHPGDLYGLSKSIGEDLARMYSEHFGIATVCLRPGTFVPCGEVMEGIGKFLGYRVDIRDVVRAYQRAIESEAEGCFFAVPQTPFTEEDIGLLRSSPWDLMEKYYPRAVGWFKERRAKLDGFGVAYSLRRATELFGFTPLHNFKEFLEERGLL